MLTLKDVVSAPKGESVKKFSGQKKSVNGQVAVFKTRTDDVVKNFFRQNLGKKRDFR